VLFIVQHGGNIKDTDGKGNTIAHFVVVNENYDILEFLSKQEANLEVQNSDGDTPLLKSVREGRKRVVHNLEAKQCDINTQGNDGMRPLDVAVLRCNSEITHLLLEQNAHSCKAGMNVVAAAQFGFLDLLHNFTATGQRGHSVACGM
jgi:ankyrin repeat protein